MLCTYAVGCDSGHQCAHGISHDLRYSIWMANLSEMCSDPEIAEITKISSFREKSRFSRFLRFLALNTILARFAVWTTFWPDPPKWPLSRIWSERHLGGPIWPLWSDPGSDLGSRIWPDGQIGPPRCQKVAPRCYI